MPRMIQVQHLSDNDQDGAWYDLECVDGRDAAYVAARVKRFRGSYGRDVRVTEVE